MDIFYKLLFINPKAKFEDAIMQIVYKHKYFIIVILTIICAVVLASAGDNFASAQQNETIIINAEPILYKNVVLDNTYTGYVVAIQSMDVRANVTGYIDDVLIKGGDNVNIGDNLVLIDQKEYKSKLDAAEAALALAKANYNNAYTYYNRVKKTDKNAISAADFDKSKADFLTAQASLKQAQAQYQTALIAFDYTVVQALINGTVGNIDVTKGNYITPANKLFSIVQFDPIRVEFAMPEKDFIKMSNDIKNQQIKLKLSDGSIYNQSGTFKYADNQLDKQTNSINLYVDFANPDKTLIVNSYVDVILQKKLSDTPLIRQNYAQIKDDGIWIFVVQNNTLKKIKLDIEGYVDDFYAVKNKFAKDEYLVIDKIGDNFKNMKYQVNIIGKDSK